MAITKDNDEHIRPAASAKKEMFGDMVPEHVDPDLEYLKQVEQDFTEDADNILKRIGLYHLRIAARKKNDT